MPRKFTYKEYYEKFKKDQGFRQYPYSNYMDNMYTKFPLMGDALIAEGQTALGQKLKQYGDHFRKLITAPEGEDPTDLNRAQWENALDAMAGLSEFMQTRDPKDGPTNYQRVLEQYRKLEIKEGFDPDRGQEIFKKEFNVFNVIGEADIPIEDLHREADVNLHPEKKEGLVEGIIEFKNNPAAKLATRLYLDARSQIRADRKARNDWQAWDASDELDDRGWGADNTFQKLDKYIDQVIAAARQAGKEELATGLQVAGRNLHNELGRAEEFGISPEAQRKFIQQLTPLVENFLAANEKLKNTEIAEVTNNWQPGPDPTAEQYLGELFNENDLKQIETFNRAPGELPFRFPKDVSYEHIAAHLAATVKEQRQKRSEEGRSGPLHVLDSLHDRLKKMADDNGEPKSVLSAGNKPRPIRKLQRAIKEVISTSINLADGYTRHDDPKSQELMAEAVEALKNLENTFGHFKIQNADLAEEIDFDDQIMSKLEEFSYLNYSKAPALDTYFLPEDKKQLLEVQQEQGLRNDDDSVTEHKENIIEDQPVKKPVAQEKMIPDEKKAAPQPTKATADRQGKTWLGYMEAHKVNPLPQGKENETLAKLLVGGNMALGQKLFSVDLARAYANKIQTYPAFKQLLHKEALVQRILRKESTPEEVAKVAQGIVHPFYGKRERQMAVLKELKELGRHMDGPAGRTRKWKALVNSIDSIDVNDPNLDPEKKLKEIYEKTEDYMKGKKRIRSSNDGKQRFNQALDVLGALGGTSPYAMDASRTIVDRINEVRGKHGEERVVFDNYGLPSTVAHENAGRQKDPTAAGKDPYEEMEKQEGALQL